MPRVQKFLAPVVPLLIVLAGARLSWAQSTLGIMVSDQPVVDGTITVNHVMSGGPGWVVIQQDDHGRPGAAIGRARIPGGESANVKAQIDVRQATRTVYAALYADSGQVGSDVLVRVDGEPVVSSFRVTGGLPETLPEAGGAPVPWAGMLMMAGLLLLTASMVLNQARRAHRAHTRIPN